MKSENGLQNGVLSLSAQELARSSSAVRILTCTAHPGQARTKKAPPCPNSRILGENLQEDLTDWICW